MKSEQAKKAVEQPQKTDAQKSSELLLNMGPDSLYAPASGLPVPYGKGVLVRKVEQTSVEETESGILLLQTSTDKSRPLHIGIIYAVGPDCSPYMRVGVRVYFNFFVDSCFRFGGYEYYKMDEIDVYYCIPNNKTILMEGVKGDREIMREKKQEKQQWVFNEQHKIDQNDLDKLADKTKGKIKPLF